MKKIEELRKELNMSIKEFSEYYEIPYNTVRQWEKGERTPPNYVIKLLNEVIDLKAKSEQLTIENANQKLYLHFNNNKPCYAHDNEEDAKKWKSFSLNVAKVHNVKVYEIEYIITKEI